MVVKDIDQQSFGLDVLQRSHEVPVVVDFWASWCGPCKVLGPVLERVAAEQEGSLELVKVDVDRNPALASQFGVQGIPTVLAFKDGRPAARFTGALPESEVRRWVAAILPTEIDRWVEQARDAVLDGERGPGRGAVPPGARRSPRPPRGRHRPGRPAHRPRRHRRGADAARQAGALLRGGAPRRAPPASPPPRAATSTPSRRGWPPTPTTSAARIELGKALAARHEYEPALDHLLAVVKAGGPEREAARQAMVDVFGVLGVAHPLTVAYRRALASALY